MATENRDWGYRRIQGALANLGHEVASGTIANILKEHGLEPVPERNRKTTGKEFLARPRAVIAAADFFTLEAWTPKGLTRFLVLFLIDLSSRKVEIGGVARQTKGLGMILFGEGSLRKANRRRYPCKPFLSHFTYFHSPSVLHLNDQRHHPGIRKIHKLQRIVRFVKAKLLRHAEVFQVRTDCAVFSVGNRQKDTVAYRLPGKICSFACLR